jgi:hypothetical protein
VGIVYYITIMRNQQRNQQHQLETRRAQLYMTLFDTINNQNIFDLWYEIKEYQFADYDEFIEKYGPVSNPEGYNKVVKVLWLFTEMGTLVHRGYITIEDVNHLISNNPILAWEKFGPIIEISRVKRYSKSSYSTFEYLAKTMIERIVSGDSGVGRVIDEIPNIGIREYRKYAEDPELNL